MKFRIRFVQETPMSVADLRLEFAIWLYQQKRLSLGQARKIAGLNIVSFQKALVVRGLYLNYDLDDLQNDLQTARLIP